MKSARRKVRGKRKRRPRLISDKDRQAGVGAVSGGQKLRCGERRTGADGNELSIRNELNHDADVRMAVSVRLSLRNRSARRGRPQERSEDQRAENFCAHLSSLL